MRRLFLLFAILLLMTASTFAQLGQPGQQPPREVPDRNGRVSVPVNPAVVAKLSELMGRGDSPEWAQMASELLRGNPFMTNGYGWYKAGQSRMTFEWLKNKYDRTRNGKVVKAELPKYVTAREFRILDKNRDTVITDEDFIWNKNPVMETGSAQQAFARMDRDSNGRLTREEMNKFFDRYADGFEYLTPQDLRRALPFQPPANRPTAEQQKKMDFSNTPLARRFQAMEMLTSGALGSFEEGPNVGDDAPDFELPMMVNDGDFYRLKLSGEKVRLSDSKGKKPVVLIFGSFT